MKSIAVKYRCPECEATHVRPKNLYDDDDEPEPTYEGECYAPHPNRGADFEGCGDVVQLEAIAWREDRGDEWIPLESDSAEPDEDGEWYETDWTLTCLDCDFSDEITAKGTPRDGPPEEVEKTVTEHKHTTDQSHVVRVKGERADRDDKIDPSLVTDGGVQTIHKEVSIEEALDGKTRDQLNLDDDEIETFIEWEKEIRRSRTYRDLARDRLDEDDLPTAGELLWVDQAEVYAVCGTCYRENKAAQWTGSTENTNFAELKRTMQEKLADGSPCEFCKNDRIDEIRDELAESDTVEVEVEVVEDAA